MSDLKPCPSCHGSGLQTKVVRETTDLSCMTCKGDGTVRRAPRFTPEERAALEDAARNDGASFRPYAATIRAMLEGEQT